MRKPILALCLSASCALVASAQQKESTASGQANVQTVATASQADKRINLESGTTVTGQLQSAIDARHAKVGDQVVLKTTQAIKSEGRTIVNKGSRLIGHVTEVTQKDKDKGQSRIGILFDHLEQGSLQAPIVATITSVSSGSANVHANNDDPFATDTMASGSAGSTSSTRSSGGNGSLLGGVGGVVNSTTSTVGSAVGSTTSAVGSTVNSTTSTVGSTAGRSLSGVQISQSSSSSVEGSSVLSLQGGSLRLEKGTSFNLILTQSTSAGTAKDQ